MSSLRRHLAFAARLLARTPAFTLTVVATLALAIGANSAVFSAIDAVVLRPLPFPNADRLVLIVQTQEGSNQSGIAPVRLEDWQRLNSTFEAMTAYGVEDASDTTGEFPERVGRSEVAPRFLEVWGVEPALGRGFTAEEYAAGGRRAAIISDRYWRTRLGAAPDVLSRTLRIGGELYTIVGVMPASFLFPVRDMDVWTPDWGAALLPPEAQRYLVWYTGIGRLEPGVTVEQAQADLDRVQAQLAAQFPQSDADVRVELTPLKQALVTGSSASLWFLFGAVSLLVLIACTNIAALLLSRATRREHEIAIRYSLGASQSSVIAQLLVEAALLAIAGAAAGLLVAQAAAAAFGRLVPDMPRVASVGVDGRVVLYAIAAAAVVTLLCGLFPAVRAARGAHTLAKAGRTQVFGHASQWLLVGVQVALSVALLAGAGLLLRSFEHLSRVDAGFDPERVLTFRVSAEWGEATQGYGEVVGRINSTIDELAGLPGIVSAATASSLPGVPAENRTEVDIVEGRADTEPRLIVERRTVSPEYFRTLGIPLVAGELCDRPADQTGTTQVMVNRRFVERYFPNRSPIGLHLAAGSPDRIMGIVGDARERGLGREVVPTVYNCFSASTVFPWFVLRTAGEPEAAIGTVRARLRELEPLRSMYEINSLEDQIGNAYAEDRLRTVLLTTFAVAALLLTCLGVYGTLSYMVSLRRREVGLRVALGALSASIVARFVLGALRVVGIACVVGLALAYLLGRALSGTLYGVEPWDPVTLVAVIVLVLSFAGFAAWLPAMRASRADPVLALRED